MIVPYFEDISLIITGKVVKVAYHEAGILHRDISAGNIMLNLAFGGILNDWDHAINAKADREGHSYRTVCTSDIFTIAVAECLSFS